VDMVPTMRRTKEQREQDNLQTRVRKESKKIYPWFFWRTCTFCKEDFKKEWGYRIIWSQSYYSGDYQTEYVYTCNQCASDNVDAFEKINALKELKEEL